MIAPRDVLDVATSLHQRLQGVRTRGSAVEIEALTRVVVSRLYYATHARAFQFAERHGFVVPPAGGSHDTMWAWLREQGWRDAAVWGSRLKGLRRIADYELGGDPVWNLEFLEAQTVLLFESLDAADDPSLD